MAKLTPINLRQRALLQRIVEGSDPVTRADTSLVTSVNALSNRGLVTKQCTTGGQWVAEATDADRAKITGVAPPPVAEAARTKAPAGQTPKLTSRGGHTLVERVALPSPWPTILQPTVDAITHGRPTSSGRLVVRGRDQIFVDVDPPLHGRALQLLSAVHAGSSRAGIGWARTEPARATLSSGTSADDQRAGILAVGEAS